MNEHCPNCKRLEKRIAILEAENAELRKKISCLKLLVKELLARLNINSRNSHKPSSSDPPSSKPLTRGKTKKRKKQRPGITREKFPPDQISEFFSFHPGNCGNCGRDIRKEPACATTVSQQIELPEINPIIREFHRQIVECPDCHTRTQAPFPAQFGSSIVGPRLAAFIGTLRPNFHLSVRQIQDLLVTLLGSDAKISLGTIINTENTINQAVAEIYQEARYSITCAPVLWVDETGWSKAGERHWLWVATTPDLTVFHLDQHRNREALRKLTGKFSGILTSDRWGSYSSYPAELRQLCFSHLKRDFQKLIDRGMGAELLGEWGKKEIKKAISLWRKYRAKILTRRIFNKAIRAMRARFKRLLGHGIISEDPVARALCKNLRKNWPAIWTFARHPDIVEPTNNRAERGLRQDVLWRKICQGSKSERGLTYAQRMMTVTATLKQQGKSLMKFVFGALNAFRAGIQLPSLLYLPSG